MTPDKLLATILDDDELLRVNALVRNRGISRARMLIMLVRSGIAVCEREDAPPVSDRRPKKKKKKGAP
jgi:hypothetical protein